MSASLQEDAPVDEDAFLNVHPLLGDVVRSVARGRVLSGTLPHPVTTIQSTVYARMDPAGPADFQFKRPYFGPNHIKVIVPNTTVRDVVQLAVDQLKAVAGAPVTKQAAVHR